MSINPYHKYKQPNVLTRDAIMLLYDIVNADGELTIDTDQIASEATLLLIQNYIDQYLSPHNSLTVVTNTNVSSTTPEQISTTSAACREVIVTAHPNNTDYITVGHDATITSGYGVVLYPGESFSFNIDDVNKLYVLSQVNGEDVSATYLT